MRKVDYQVEILQESFSVDPFFSRRGIKCPLDKAIRYMKCSLRLSSGVVPLEFPADVNAEVLSPNSRLISDEWGFNRILPNCIKST